MYGRLNTVQSFDTGKGDAIRYLDGTARKLADVQSIGSGLPAIEPKKMPLLTGPRHLENSS